VKTGVEQAGMGYGIGDFDFDGNLDIFRQTLPTIPMCLSAMMEKVTLTISHPRWAIGVETRYVGWGQDSLIGQRWSSRLWFITTGSVTRKWRKKLPTYPFHTPRLVFRNLGDGRFENYLEEAGNGVSEAHCSRGCRFWRFSITTATWTFSS